MLKIDNLHVSFNSSSLHGKIDAVRGISLEIGNGEIFALVGESGSGKSVSALSILKLLPYPSAEHSEGKIFFEEQDLLTKSNSELRKIRGNKISMIFQEPMTSLNPLHTIEKQIAESITLHNRFSKDVVNARVLELISLVGLDELKNRMNAFPHELSGGQRQRIMIAMSIANNPDLLIADEPTTALDVTVQAQILTLIKGLQKRLGMSVLLITHDLGIVRNIASRMAVMQSGKIVESGKTENIFTNPQHSYTKRLIASFPDGKAIQINKNAAELILVDNLSVRFPVKKGLFGTTKEFVIAVDNVSFSIKESHTLGVVGESGSGKTTLAMAILRLINSHGRIFFQNKNIHDFTTKEMRYLRSKMQIVFQDPFSSLNPRMTIGQIVGEGLIAHGLLSNREDHEKAINNALTDVELDINVKDRYPHEFSGGQRQRIGIARALVLHPQFIALDEPTSALDISTQSEVLNVLKTLQERLGLTYLFISHDLRVIKSISHDIIVMKNGCIIESGTSDELFENPRESYTRELISSSFTDNLI